MHATINRTLWILAVTFMATTLFAGGPGQVRKVIDQEASGGGSFDGDLSGSDLTDSSDGVVTVDDDLVVTGDVTADSLVLDAANGASNVVVKFAGSGKGWYSHVTGGWAFSTGSVGKALLSDSRLRLASDMLLSFGSGNNVDTTAGDTFLRRASASVLQIDADGAGAAATLAVQTVSGVGSGALILANNGQEFLRGSSTTTVFNGRAQGPSSGTWNLRPGSGQTLVLQDEGGDPALTVSADGYLQMASRLQFGSDSDTFVYQAGGDRINLVAGGSEILTLQEGTTDTATFNCFPNFTTTAAADTTTPTLIALPTGGTAAQAGWVAIQVSGSTAWIPYWQ